MTKSNRYDSLFVYFAVKENLNWKLVKSQAMAESSLNPTSKSPVGAEGLMQFMPKTWEEITENNPFKSALNPEYAIEFGCKYLRQLMNKFMEIPCRTERLKFALASYNAGRGNINKALSKARESELLPYSFSLWEANGKEKGDWQTWEYTKNFLKEVTGLDNSTETLNYIDKIFKLKEEL